MYSDRTGVYVGSGGGNYENQYDYFPLFAEARGELPAFGRELANTVNPMWLLRTLPNNVLGHIGIKHGLKGSNACITNHSVGGTLAVIEAFEALRNGEADRAVAVGHETPIEPQMVLYYHRLGLLATEMLRPFDARHDGSLFGEGAGALMLETEASAAARKAPVLGEVLGGGYACEAQGLAAIRDDGDGLARAIGQALDDAKPCARRRRNDRRARQRHAAVRRLGGRGDPPRFRRRGSARHRFQVGDRAHDRRRRNSRGGAGARGACAQRRAGHRESRAARSRCAGLPVSAAAQAPRSKVALILCRGFAGTNAALVVRGALATDARSALMADALAPAGRCGIDTVEIARIERLLAETPAEDLAQDLLRGRARRERRRARARREPRRPLRREGSVREAVPARSRAGRDRASRFFDRARQLRRAARRLRAPRRERCSAGIASRRSPCR